MAKSKSYAEALALALSGGTGGAQTGYKVGGPGGALTGGLLGAGLGAVGGFLDSEGNSPYDQLNLQEQGLTNDALQQNLQDLKRKNRTAQTMENGMNIFRNLLGAGFKSGNPGSFSGALKAYPGLGNQAVP